MLLQMLGLTKDYSNMKRILLIISILFTSQSFAAAPTFCSSPTMASQSGCVSTCTAIATAGSFSLSSGNYGRCVGKATSDILTIYKIELGRVEIGNEQRCTIWEGDDLTVNLSGVKANINSKFPIDLSSCKKGVEFDVIYMTLDRYNKFAAEAAFPDNSGKIARTTSIYAAKDGAVDNSNISSWRDTGYIDTSKYYMKPDAGLTSGHFKKLSEVPSDTDLANSSNVEMYIDMYKDNYVNFTDSSSRAGFLCAAGDVNDCNANIADNKMIAMMNPNLFPMTGLPLTLKEGDETLNIEYIKYASDRSGETEHVGAYFLWNNDGGTLKYIGVMQEDGGGELIIGKPRSVDGL